MKKLLLTFALLSSCALADVQKYVDGEKQYVVMPSFWVEMGWQVQMITDPTHGEGWQLKQGDQTIKIFQKDFALVNNEKVSLTLKPYLYFGRLLMNEQDVLNVFKPAAVTYQLLDYKTGVVLNPAKPKPGGFFGETQIITPPTPTVSAPAKPTTETQKPGGFFGETMVVAPTPQTTQQEITADVFVKEQAEARGFSYVSTASSITPTMVLNNARTSAPRSDLKVLDFQPLCPQDLTPRLLSPATAEYGGFSKTFYYSNGVMYVQGIVDTHNMYGALQRYPYACYGIMYQGRLYVYSPKIN